MYLEDASSLAHDRHSTKGPRSRPQVVPHAPQTALPQPAPVVLLAIILACYLMIVLDVSIVITALPEIHERPRLLLHQPLLGAERLHARPSAACCCSAPGPATSSAAAASSSPASPSSPPPRCSAASPSRPAWLLAARALQGVGAAIAAPVDARAAHDDASPRAPSAPARSPSTAPSPAPAAASAWSRRHAHRAGSPGAGACSSTCRSASP